MSRIGKIVETGRAVVRNLALGGNLAALSLVSRPRALVSYTAETLFLLGAIRGRPGVRATPITEALGAGTAPRDITLAHLDDRGWFGPTPTYTADLIGLCMLCRVLDPRAVFEIGTLHGFTALHMALNSGPDATIYTLDLPQDAPAAPALRTTIIDDDHIRAGRSHTRRVFEDTAAAERIIPLFGDSATFDFTPYHGRIDLFFIDGAHSYDYVASDTRNAFACVRPGGVIAWHDFGRTGVNGVGRVVREVARDRTVHAVPGGSLAYTVI